MSEKLFRVGDRVISQINVEDIGLLIGRRGEIKRETYAQDPMYDWEVLFDGDATTVAMAEHELIIEA